MTTATLQPPTYDTFLDSANPTTNYNTSVLLMVGESNAASNYIGRSLLKWDSLSDGTIPATATITSAKLTLVFERDRSSNARTLRIYRMKTAWVPSQCTWNIKSTGNNWTTAGGFDAADCEQTDIGNVSLSDAETPDTALEITLTNSAIQSIVSGAFSNNGFLIKMDTETNDMYIFHSQENTDSASWDPKLVIEYTTPAVSSFQQKIIYID